MAKHPHNIQSIPNGTDQVSLLPDLLKEIFCFLASILIFFHPGPPGLVFLQKLIKDSDVSGFVKKVTKTHIIVVIKTTTGNL